MGREVYIDARKAGTIVSGCIFTATSLHIGQGRKQGSIANMRAIALVGPSAKARR